MQNELIGLLEGKVVIVGLGHVLRGDDGFGPVLVERLKQEVDAVCIVAGSALENYLGKIVSENPDTILIIDAIDSHLKPGRWEILGKDDILKTGFTTHDLSPHMAIEFLEQASNAKILMLGVQAQNIKLGDPMSEPVVEALDHVEQLVQEAIHARNASHRTDH